MYYPQINTLMLSVYCTVYIMYNVNVLSPDKHTHAQCVLYIYIMYNVNVLSPDKHTNAQCALYIYIMYNVNALSPDKHTNAQCVLYINILMLSVYCTYTLCIM